MGGGGSESEAASASYKAQGALTLRFPVDRPCKPDACTWFCLCKQQNTFTPASPITIQPRGMPPGVPYLLLPSAEQNPAPSLLPPWPCPSDVLLTVEHPQSPCSDPSHPAVSSTPLRAAAAHPAPLGGCLPCQALLPATGLQVTVGSGAEGA